MKIYQIIEIVGLLVWLIVPILYLRHDKFYFFLFLGLTDLIAQFLWNGLNISAIYAWLPFHYLMLIGFNRDYFVKHIKYLWLGLIPILIINPFLSHFTIKSVVLIFHLVFITLFVRLFASQLIKNNNFSFFYIIMITYEGIMIFRIIASLRDLKLGMEISYLGAFLQIFIGVLLIIIQLRKNYKEKPGS